MRASQKLARAWLRAVRALNDRFKAASMRLTKWTGRSRVPLHPKHLLGDVPGQHWYLDHVRDGMQVLDVGSGSGAQCLRLAGAGATAWGLDRDRRQLADALTLAESAGRGRILFACADVEAALPLREAAFDVALLLDVLEHLFHRDRLLAEVGRVLTPGGTLLLSVPNRDTTWKRRLRAAGLFAYTDRDHKIEYTLPEIEAELAEAGFALAAAPEPVVYDTPWAGLIDLVGGLSPRLYRRLVLWKIAAAARHPGESIGWRFVCRRVTM